jgi:hypothetical protein
MLGGAGFWHKRLVSFVEEESRMCVLNHGDADLGMRILGLLQTLRTPSRHVPTRVRLLLPEAAIWIPRLLLEIDLREVGVGAS